MKRLFITACAACSLLTLTAVAAEPEGATSSGIDFGTFSPPEDGTFVEIKVNSSLIKMATRLTEESEPELARILGGLNSIRVNVMEFKDEDKQAIQAKVMSVREQLDQQQWQRVVTVKEDAEDVGIYVRLKDEESIEGVAVTVIGKGEAVLIHVDGRIRPEELAQVGKRLNIEPLEQLGKRIDNGL